MDKARAIALALALIMGWEGFRALPYLDEAGRWTQGYGETQGVTASAAPVTQAQAEAQLKRRVTNAFVRQLEACITHPLTANQYAALLCATYYVGGSLVCGSTLQRKFNSGDTAGGCAELLRWNKLRERGVLCVSRGLTNRRIAEFNLCMKGP